MDVDIYDLTNFNYNDDPVYIIDFSQNTVNSWTNIRIPLCSQDKTNEIMTVIFNNLKGDNKHYAIKLYSPRGNYFFVNVNMPININPCEYLIDSTKNTIMKVYRRNNKYDVTLMYQSTLDVPMSSTLCKYILFNVEFANSKSLCTITYMIDILCMTNSVPQSRKFLYDRVHKEKDIHIYFKYFKLNHESIRIYIHYVIWNNTKIYLNKFSKNNVFIKHLHIEYKEIEHILDNGTSKYINNMKWPFYNKLFNYEICFYQNILT